MNTTKNVTIINNKPKSDVLLSIRSFARSYKDRTSKRYLKCITWVENQDLK